MFVAMGAVGLIVAGVWFLFYRDADQYGTEDDRSYIRSGDTARTSSPVGLKQRGRLFRCRTTWGMIIGNFGGGYLTWVYYAWLPGFLEIQHHMSIARTGIFAAIPPVFGIIGSLFGGYASDRLAARGFTPLNSRKIPIICGLLGTAALTIATAYATNEAAVMSYVSLAYLLSGVASASVWAIVTAAAPPDYIASSGSIQNFGGYVGGIRAPPSLLASLSMSQAPSCSRCSSAPEWPFSEHWSTCSWSRDRSAALNWRARQAWGHHGRRES